MATYDYSKLTLIELIKKIGNSRYWNLPKMLEEVLTKIKSLNESKYKVYSALLTQTGTNAPVVTVLENTLDGDIVWSRIDVGEYYGTLTGAFIVDKTFVNVGSNEGTLAIGGVRNNNDRIYVSAANTLDGEYTDNLHAGEVSIEIRVYN